MNPVDSGIIDDMIRRRKRNLRRRIIVRVCQGAIVVGIIMMVTYIGGKLL